MTSFDAALQEGRRLLADAGAESAALDARLLLCAAAGIETAALIAGGREPMPAAAADRYRQALARRAAGEPVARVLGRKEFWGLAFEVNEATLVPRPDTEILVEAVLDVARSLPAGIRICDLGTGSGAILVALLTELPHASGVAVDICPAALAAARANAERLGVAGRTEFRLGDFAEIAADPFDVVVANPPYIRSAELSELAREVRGFDPLIALDGGPDGLSSYRAIIDRVGDLLVPGGLLALEVGCGQADMVSRLCRAGKLNHIAVRSDLSGIERVVTARLS